MEKHLDNGDCAEVAAGTIQEIVAAGNASLTRLDKGTSLGWTIIVLRAVWDVIPGYAERLGFRSWVWAARSSYPYSLTNVPQP